MAQLRRCAYPYQLAATALNKWPDGTEVTYWYGPELGPETIALGDAAIAKWLTVCGAKIRRTEYPGDARVQIRGVYLDGPGGELGLTDLPMGTADQVVILRIDNSDTFTAAELSDTILHEFGHALGLLHAPDDVPSCMSAYLNESITDPQPWDATQAQLRCGPPSPGAAPQPPAAGGDAPSNPTPAAGDPLVTADVPFETVFPLVAGTDTVNLDVHVHFPFVTPEAGTYEVSGTVHYELRKK